MSDTRTAQGAEPERRESRARVTPGSANDTPQARRAETRRFLHLLDPEADGFAFRSFDDNSDRAQKNLARKLNGTFTEHRADLEMLNMRGAGVFVGVNAGGQRGQEIVRVRAVWADDDGNVPIEQILQQSGLDPHFVVETSPEHYQIFWLVDGMPLDKFSGVQTAIAAEFGTDPSVKDLPRVTRVPGFDHCKGKRFLSRIIYESGGLPYSAEKILARFPPASGGTTKRPPEHVNGEAVVIDKARHEEMISFVAREVIAGKRNGKAEESIWAGIVAERDRERWTRHFADDELRRAFAGALVKFKPTARAPDPPINDDDERRADADIAPIEARSEPAHVSDYVPKPARRMPQVKAVSDLIGKHFDPIKWAIRDLIPEGIILLVGAPKLGKSWFALQCGIAISAELALWVGRPRETRGEVLLLALEDNDRRMASRVTKLHAEGVDLTRLHYATEWPRADKGGIEALDAWLAEHPDCRLIVIDTLARWRGEAKRSDSAYSTDYEVGSQLKPLADRYHVAIVLVHHTRKAISADVLDSASGTLGLTGSVDAAMILRRERGAMDAALFCTGRDIEIEADHALRFDPETCLWSGVGSVHDAQVSRERREILDYLAVSPMSRPKQIADGIGKKSGAVRFLLHRMFAAREVEEIGGCYRVPNIPTNSANSSDVNNSAGSGDRSVSGVSTEIPPCPKCDGEGCGFCARTNP